MSWTPRAVVISGYKIPNHIWRKGFEYYEDHLDLPGEWEDYFISLDSWRADPETFFGAIIHSVDTDSPAKEFNSIIAHQTVIKNVQYAFHSIFDPIYTCAQEPLPQYSKYLGCQWV